MPPSNAWYDLTPGDVVDGPSVTVTDDLVQRMVDLGGFVHPLFADPAYAAASGTFASRPLPGTAGLHVLAGLAEQSGMLDDTVIGLVGFEDVRLREPVLVGDELGLRLTLLEVRPTSKPGRVVVRTAWEGVVDGTVRLTATAAFLAEPPADR